MIVDPPGLIAWPLVVLWGLVAGSFATALIWRIPRGHSWILRDKKPVRSACTLCGHTLGPADLIPVFSWLFSRGRCRHCGAPYGMRYPTTELGTLLACVIAYAAMGTGGFIFIITIPFLVALLVIDLEHMILPDQLNLIVGVMGLLAVFRHEAFLMAALYGSVALLFYYGGQAAFKKEALGWGDVKFFAAAGAWLDLAALPYFLIIAGLSGVGVALIWKFMGKKEAMGPFPFGPGLIAALFILVCLQGAGAGSILP